MEIIIRGKDKKYRQFRHRSGVEEVLRKEWGGGGMTEEQLDKLKWIEKQSGLDHSSVKKHVIDEIIPEKK